MLFWAPSLETALLLDFSYLSAPIGAFDWRA